MKSVVVFLVALCAVAYALPSRRDPAKREEFEEEYESPRQTGFFYMPRERSFPRTSPFQFTLTDDLVPPPVIQNPFFRSGANPWGPAAEGDPEVDDFMTKMQEMLTDMRRQLTELLHKSQPGSDIEGDDGVGTRVGAPEDTPKNKTTSTTKVIDGHIVTVNETTYSSGDDNIGAVFRVKIVEVHPSETPEVEGETEAEIVPENPDETFVPEQEPTTSKSELDDKNEETNEIPNAKVRYQVNPELDPSLNEIEDFSVEDFRPHKKESFYDLSGDTKVNDYLAEQSEHQQLVMMEPDAEFIETEIRSVYPQKPQRLERFRYL